MEHLAEQGDARAQANLGLMYHNGWGAPQDYAQAVRWYRLAAEQGDASAQFNLGAMYDFGSGVPQDYAEAVRWYRLAAEGGDLDAQFSLGTLFWRGRGGLLQDRAEAIKWMRKAAEQGNVHAQAVLGHMYRPGRGLEQDYTTAHMWFNISAANGSEESRTERDNLEKLMTTDSVSEAQRRARVCMASGYQDCD